MSSDSNTDVVNDTMEPIQQEEWTSPLVNTSKPPPNKLKCGNCGVLGHNKRTCPLLLHIGMFIDDVVRSSM